MLDETRNPIYNETGIDQLILTPEARATVITKKKPKMVKIPIYAKDSRNEKIPLMDSEGNLIIDEDGAQKYLIKEYKYEQRGWMPKEEIVPASEIFTIDASTSSIGPDAVRLLTFLMWNYNHIMSLHESTDDDYSVLLHKIRNDAVAILSAAKSYRGGTVSAVKTFRSIQDSNQWAEEHGEEPEQKKGFLGGVTAPLSTMFGGRKKAPPKVNYSRPVAFT